MYQTLAWPLRRAAQIRPDGEAIVDGPVRRTWDEVHDRLARLASGLDRLYIAPGDRVGVLAHNSGNHLEAWLGLPAHRRVINDLNLRLTAPELAFMIDDCECVALLADDDHFEVARGLMEQCPSLRELVYIGSQPQVPDDARSPGTSC
jgi:acyl-CoA synthetase (AMP-forming)/AMP-acid ligase II